MTGELEFAVIIVTIGIRSAALPQETFSPSLLMQSNKYFYYSRGPDRGLKLYVCVRQKFFENHTFKKNLSKLCVQETIEHLKRYGCQHFTIKYTICF